ncbi:MAG TPA: hypothetical protein VF982_10440 [Anaerolineales bacterium]
MANLVLVTQAARESEYTGHHIRHLIRHKLVNGKKEGGIWLVDLDDLKRYEQAMQALGAKKFDPTRGQSGP